VARTIENWVNPPLVPQFDPNKPDINRVTVYAYDTLGRVTSTTQNYAPGSTGTALNRVSLTEFHPTTGRVTGQRDALGRWVNQQYDLLGRTITTIQNCTNSGGTPVNPAQAACAAFSNSYSGPKNLHTHAARIQ
jgi:YD repeat-containing protein